MPTKKSILILTFALTSLLSTTFSQEFHKDGTMKVTEISKDKNYGYEANHKASIKVGSVANEYAYIAALDGPNGEQIEAKRIASCCSFKSKTAIFGTGLLDVWEITYAGLKEPLTIYLNGYDYDTPKCPNGLSIRPLNNQKVQQSISPEAILKVNPCKKHSYAVDNFLLKEKIGEKELPTTSPTFEGGIDSLKVYFKDNPLVGEDVSKMLFRVVIAFEVNCKGEAGNYEVISKGQRVLATYANQILAIVNEMPQRWQAAIKNGKPVDCYQVLTFTVREGSLENVSYSE